MLLQIRWQNDLGYYWMYVLAPVRHFEAQQPGLQDPYWHTGGVYGDWSFG